MMTEKDVKPKEWTTIHPALDFTEDHAYIGQRLRYQREASYHIITDEGFVIPALPESLEQNHLELTHTPYIYAEARWTTASINTFSRLKRFPNEQPIAVNKTQLLADIKTQFQKYIELADERYYSFFALWTIGTYCFPFFNTYPYVHLVGLMQSGKSKLLSLCSCLSFNGFLSANITPACLFRLIEGARTSLFIDEAENLADRRNSEDIRSILLSGYRKGELAFRAERDSDGNFIPRGYEVYGPKMVANIEGLEAVLASRCIPVPMQRGSNDAIMNSEVSVTDTAWQQIRDNIYPFIMVNWKGIRQSYIEFHNDTGITGRELELWKPILAIAKFYGDEVFAEMKTFAIEKSAEKTKNLVTEEQILLETLLSITGSDDYYSLRKIRNVMTTRHDFNGWLDPRRIAGLLKALGFSRIRRMSWGTEFWLEVEKIKETARKYGVSADGADSADKRRRAVAKKMTIVHGGDKQ